MKYNTPQILETLRERLTLAHYPLGTKLRPAVLADEFGVSANTVRDVLLRLLAAGLLDYEDQRGFRVTADSPRRVHELTEFRILLEQEGATRSIQRGGLEWEAQMTAAHHKLSHIEARMTRADDLRTMLRTWNAAELEFHMSLLAAAQMPVLLETFGQVFAQFRQQVVSSRRGYSHRPGNIAQHHRILEAAVNRDAAACRQAIHDHLANNLLPEPAGEAPGRAALQDQA